VVNGVLMLSGTIAGTGIPAGGTPFMTAVVPTLAAPVCQILNLNIQPINLDLLGLVVNLDAVHLDITGQRDRASCSATCCVASPAPLTRLAWRSERAPQPGPPSPRPRTGCSGCFGCSGLFQSFDRKSLGATAGAEARRGTGCLMGWADRLQP